MSEAMALIEISFGPLPTGSKWSDFPHLQDLSDRIAAMIFDPTFVAALPGLADPGMSGLIRSLDDLDLDEESPQRTVEEVYANLGHYTSTYCQHGHHGDCRYFCKYKTCRAPCKCHCHEGKAPPKCTTAGHEDARAAGACRVGDVDDDRAYPYCRECLDRLDPVGDHSP